MSVEAKFVKEVPDTHLPVDLVVYKHQNGGMFAVDASFIEQVDEDEGYSADHEMEWMEGATSICAVPDPFSDREDPQLVYLIEGE